jgi:hypothetical protein
MHSKNAITMVYAIAAGVILTAGAGSSSSLASTTPTKSTVNFVVADTAPTSGTVLSFQVEITKAVLQPGNVSILPRPVIVDLSELVTDTGMLASTVIDSGTYTSLTISFASPKVTLVNTESTPITIGGHTCAAGATCTYTPAFNEASITISNGVFPITVKGSSTTGLTLNLSIPDLLQTDAEITLADGKSVNIALLPEPKSGTSQQAEVDDVMGTIKSISGTQVEMTTAYNGSLVLTESSSTTFKYPTGVCAAPSAACLAVGQVVTANLRLLGDGALALNAVSYLGGSGAELVKGLVLSTDLTAAVPSVKLLVQRTVNVPSLTTGEIATVSFPMGTAYSIGSPAYPGTSGAGFSSDIDLLTGQELVLHVASGLVASSTPSFNTDNAYLESSQVVGKVASVNTESATAVLNTLSGVFSGAKPVVKQMDVTTDTATTYIGFSPAAFASVKAGQYIAAKGPLFGASNASSSPALGAIQLRKGASTN